MLIEKLSLELRDLLDNPTIPTSLHNHHLDSDGQMKRTCG